MHLLVKGIKVYSNEGPCPFPMGDNYKIEKIHWQNLKIFSRVIGPISTKLGTMHPRGTQICSNEGPCPFPRGDIYEIAKIHRQNLRIFFSRTTGPMSTKPTIVLPRMRGIQVCSNEEPVNLHKVNNDFFLLLIIILIILCVSQFSKSFRWALWPMDLLFVAILVIRWRLYCKCPWDFWFKWYMYW